jgi:hypothetical protein
MKRFEVSGVSPAAGREAVGLIKNRNFEKRILQRRINIES